MVDNAKIAGSDTYLSSREAKREYTKHVNQDADRVHENSDNTTG